MALNSAETAAIVSATIAADTTITKQGNAFNGANQLVKLTAGGALPAVDGSNLTGVASAGFVIAMAAAL